MRAIPVELQDYVLDNLRGSRATLVNCALVCRAWRRRTRFNLFHTVHINWEERKRTIILFEELLETHSLVRELRLSTAAGMQPEDLVGLLDTLENLEVLSIRWPGPNPDLSTLIRVTTNHMVYGERLLFAIARMERLRTLSFARGGMWVREARPDDGMPLDVPGLRALRTLNGDLFPPARMYRLWEGLVAAKAEGSAAPLEHLEVFVYDFPPLARFIRDVGTQLKSISLCISEIFQITASDVREGGLSLSQCTRLRTLTLYVKAPCAFNNGHLSACAALLSTATKGVPLAHVRITVIHFCTAFFVVPHVPESARALDQSITGLPHLKRVDWNLSHCLPETTARRSCGDKSPLDLFRESFPQLAAQEERIKVKWRSSMAPTPLWDELRRNARGRASETSS